MTAQVWLLLLTAMCFYGIGEYFSKEFATHRLYSYMLIGFISYSINALLFFPTLCKMNSLSILGTIWNVGYVTITLFLGLIIFKEDVNLRQIIGITLAFVGILLLS